MKTDLSPPCPAFTARVSALVLLTLCSLGFSTEATAQGPSVDVAIYHYVRTLKGDVYISNPETPPMNAKEKYRETERGYMVLDIPTGEHFLIKYYIEQTPDGKKKMYNPSVHGAARPLNAEFTTNADSRRNYTAWSLRGTGADTNYINFFFHHVYEH